MQSHYKDHYKTLGVSPGATADQIKKAWRKLVLDLHPDKTGNDAAASVRFSEIQQAYEVLNDPIKKIQFLQERWLRKSQGQDLSPSYNDLASWIKECLALEKKVNTQDPDRIDQQRLLSQIEQLANSEKIASLRHYADPEALLTGSRLLLRAAMLLPYPLFIQVSEHFLKIETENLTWQKEIQKVLRQKRNSRNIERYKILFLILVTLLLCILIAS